jgi:hypothetical protein
VYSLTSPLFSLPVLCSASSPQAITDRWTIELGDGGGFPIWTRSDGADLAASVVVVTFLLVALALLLSLSLPIEEEEVNLPQMPSLPSKTAETPANGLPFPGRLVEGKYDVQYLHL